MNDLISRQELIDAFKEEFYAMYADDFNYMIRFFNNLPAFEPDPAMCWGCNCPKMPDAEKKGMWKTEYDTHTKMLACSACGGRVIYSAYTSAVGTKGYAYCPYCGARMEE